MWIGKEKYTYEFRADSAPAARCADGDIVEFDTEDCFAGEIVSEEQTHPVDFDHTNPATGPLYVEGAKPGDALAVDILKIETAAGGVCCTIENCGALWPQSELRTRMIPVENGCARFLGEEWPVKPMIGVIGTAPGQGSVPTGHSFRCGGNMDSSVITQGVTVYLPVETPGALLSIGDLHASMGDGEVCGTGIEIAGRVTVRVRVIPGAGLNWPVTETESAWFVNTNGVTADEAIRRGYAELSRLLRRAHGWDGTDAAMYLSLRGIVAANQACLGENENEDDTDGPTFRVGCPKTSIRLIP